MCSCYMFMGVVGIVKGGMGKLLPFYVLCAVLSFCRREQCLRAAAWNTIVDGRLMLLGLPFVVCSDRGCMGQKAAGGRYSIR